MPKYKVHLRSTKEHPKQDQLVNSQAKRIIVRAGRRFGKTVGLGKRAVRRFLSGRRQLYAAPTSTQTDAFWYEVMRALGEPIEKGVFKLNETERYIELPGTKQRIKAKTAWNANTLRGDFADDLYLDEFQLMAEDTWDEVGQPMLIDNNGDAVFCYTPPSLASSGVSKARDPRHASKFFKKAQVDTSGLWETIHGTSYDSPYISAAGLDIVTQGMSLDAHRREIMAEDDEIESGWLVYARFNELLCKVSRLIIPRTWDVYSGHDFGSANPGALFIAQNPGPDEPRTSTGQQIRKGDFVIFREYAPGGGLSTFQHVQNFKEICRGYNVRRSVGGNATTEEEIRQGYTAHGWPIQAPKLSRVNAQIDRVLGLMDLNKLWIFDDLYHILGQLSNCMWKLDDQMKPTNIIQDEARYHLLACLRYIGSDFTPETIVKPDKVLVVQY